MATDAQGRQLSDDGYYYWDGSQWQPVSDSGSDSASSQQAQSQAQTDAQGRQLSEDGNYYWDGSQWQQVSQSGGAADGGQPGGDAGSPRFAINNQGLDVEVDDNDNPSGHVVGVDLFSDAGTKVGFSIMNVGSAAGAADVNIKVDGNLVKTWTSQQLAQGGSEIPNDTAGFVNGCGRYSAGDHEFLIEVGPTGFSGQADDSAKNTKTVSDP